MNSLVVYFSKFGNTQIVAKAIAGVLAKGGEARLVNSDELSLRDLEETDFLVMGSPTHKMNLPLNVRPVFERLPKRILRGKPVAAFDTSYRMSWWLNQYTAGKRLVKKLRKLGGKSIVPAEIFLVTGREGPLYDGEIERAKQWADLLLEKVKK
ncbi:MAG: flavodoxin family protein [Anaerolineales bacterium]|nr:MAG: flavodoxin family protein [Anaerolineales bacterium]